MPNWCSNHITVRGTDPAEIQRLADAFKDQRFCNAVIPIPEELTNPDTGSYGGVDADAKDQLRASLLEKYGFSGWYDFCVARWGTKWDVGDHSGGEISDDGLEFSASFESAWSPPVGVAEALFEQGYEVTLYYYEPGMCFAGVWSAGNDDYYSDWGDSKGAKSTLPTDLDDMFGISDSMAEWEAENEEDLHKWVREGGEQLGLAKL